MDYDHRDKRGPGGLVDFQEWPILMSRKSSKGSRMPTGMNKELLTVEVEADKGDLGGVQGLTLHVQVRKPKPT